VKTNVIFNTNNVATLFISALFSLVVSSTVNAKLYRWVDENNVTHYTNTPPPTTSSKELVNSSVGFKNLPEKKNQQEDDQQAKKEVEPEKVVIPPIVTLKGAWCEYKIEENNDNKKTNIGTWTFSKKDEVQFNELATGKTIIGKYKIEGGHLEIDNIKLGNHKITNKKGLVLTISHDSNTRYWLRGRCTN